MNSKTEHSIAEALKSRIKGEVLFDDLSRALYSTDASIYEIQPLGVVLPRDEEDVAELVRFAREEGISLMGRGGGSGLAGESLGRGILVDFTRHMDRFRSLDLEKGTVTVEPGMVLDRLNRRVLANRKKFGPDPASSSRCTVGGIIANNSTGAHSLRYGYTRDHLVSMKVVLSDGQTAVFEPVQLEGERYRKLATGDSLEARLYQAFPALLKQHAALIEEKTPKTKRHRCGYLLNGVLQDGILDLGKVICGSEGTLGLVTEATLRLVDIPACVGLGLFHFATLDDAARGIGVALDYNPAVIEIMDHFVIELARQAGHGQYLPGDVGGLLIIECDGSTPDEVRHSLEQIRSALCGAGKLSSHCELALERRDQAKIWAVRKSIEPIMYRYPGKRHPVGFVEDTAVHPLKLPQYLKAKQEIFSRHGVQFATYAHGGAGALHTRPFLDLRQGKDIELMETLARELYEALWNLGGTISGEHADGLSRTQFIPGQYGELYPVLEQVKQLFDPENILNPGKKVGNKDPHLLIHNLRYGAGYEASPYETNLHFDPDELADEIDRCNGNGECRTLAPEVAMCPLFHATQDEAATPRAKGNLMRLLLNGRLPRTYLHHPDFKAIADLCVNCKMCVLECPSSVNIPKLMLEAKAEYVRVNGQSLVNQFLMRTDLLSTLGSWTAPMANFFNRLKPARLMMEKTIGIDRRRELPAFSFRTFKGKHGGNGKLPSQKGKQIAYFVDYFVNYNDPQLGEAFLKVMQLHGMEVLIPEQKGSAMPAMDYGSVDIARKGIRYNAVRLAPYARQGIPVVCTEPTAALSLRDEYPDFCHEKDVLDLASQVFEATDFLWKMHQEGQLRTEFHPIRKKGGYHAPCHLKALRVGRPALELLALIPELEIEEINEGCCGIAGTFGFKKGGYDHSMKVGAGLFNRLLDDSIDFGVTECSTCKMQMEQGSRKKAFHPVKLLAVSYGLLEIEALF